MESKPQHSHDANTDVHEEWMLWCLADVISDEVKSYQVSRGDHPDNVLVYKVMLDENGTRRYYLANLSTNVRNVTEGLKDPSEIGAPEDTSVPSEEPAGSS